jgi:hypothetical protein
MLPLLPNNNNNNNNLEPNNYGGDKYGDKLGLFSVSFVVFFWSEKSGYDF